MTAPLFAASVTAALMAGFVGQVRDGPARPVVGSALIAGIVLAGPTGSEPARKARVLLNSADGRGVGLTATTDDDGGFEFRDVPAGRFTLQAVKAGYLTAAYGAARPNRAGTAVTVGDGSRVAGLTMRLVRGGVITGTVRDERGAPVSGVWVSALKFGYSSVGERRVSRQSNDGLTDDRGVYRVWGLPPGEYLAMASPSITGARSASASEGSDFRRLTRAEVDRALSGANIGVGAVVTVGPVIGMPASPTVNYAPVFHPAATDVALASTLTLGPGEERTGVDIGIRLVRTARVRGSIRMPDGTPPPRATVTLSAAGEYATIVAGTAFRPRSVSLDAKGEFAIADVAPGTYTVLARTQATSSPVLWAMTEITIDGSDAALSLEMQPAMRVSGRVEFDGVPPADPTMQIWMVPPGNVALNSGPPGGAVAADGTFAFTGVTPGQYRMAFQSNRAWSGTRFLRSARANGRDTLDSALNVSPGENVEWVLTFTDRPTEIAGVLQDATGRPATEYFIVVFPQDRATWRPGSVRIRSTRPADDGTFSVRGLPPGGYLLAALTDLESDDLNSSAFLEQLISLAIRIALAEGQVVKQDLRIGR